MLRAGLDPKLRLYDSEFSAAWRFGSARSCCTFLSELAGCEPAGGLGTIWNSTMPMRGRSLARTAPHLNVSQFFAGASPQLSDLTYGLLNLRDKLNLFASGH